MCIMSQISKGVERNNNSWEVTGNVPEMSPAVLHAHHTHGRRPFTNMPVTRSQVTRVKRRWKPASLLKPAAKPSVTVTSSSDLDSRERPDTSRDLARRLVSYDESESDVAPGRRDIKLQGRHRADSSPTNLFAGVLAATYSLQVQHPDKTEFHNLSIRSRGEFGLHCSPALADVACFHLLV